MDSPENFISFIHNYCDRWCERCEFTARCRVFAVEEGSGVANSDDPMGDAVRTVAQSLAEAEQMLTEHANEIGIDLDAAMNDPEIMQGIERRRTVSRGQEPVQLAKKYALETRQVLETSSRWLAGDADPLTEEMLAIIGWYLFFIPAKVNRGYHGIVDQDGEEDADELRDVQSDANGSIKIALIAIERSILAWTYLLTPENKQVLVPLIETLKTICSTIEQKFPNARDFIRPGFDEIQTVM